MFSIGDYLDAVSENIEGDEIISRARELLGSLPIELLEQDFEDAGSIAFDMMLEENEEFADTDSIDMREFMYWDEGAEAILGVIEVMAEDY
jgi:hypothetical protein